MIAILATIPEITIHPANKALLEIGNLEDGIVYPKTRLAKMWGINRRTISRWHTLAVDYCPGYAEGFLKVLYRAQCPECNAVYELSYLQYQKAQRKWAIQCPHCKQENVPDTKILEASNLALKIEGKYAKVLRLVGALISTLGRERAIAALTIDPDHRKTREFIRSILIRKVK